MKKGAISFDGKRFTLDLEEKKSKFVKRKEFSNLVVHVTAFPMACEYEAISSTITCIILGGRKYENETLARDMKVTVSPIPSSLAPSADLLFSACSRVLAIQGKRSERIELGRPTISFRSIPSLSDSSTLQLSTDSITTRICRVSSLWISRR